MPMLHIQSKLYLRVHWLCIFYSHDGSNPMTSFCYFRNRKTSITTGVVERSESIKNEPVDRLSPLNSTTNPIISFPVIDDPSDELEKFVEMDIDSQIMQTPDVTELMYTNVVTSTPGSNTRRHTVGPGNVEHEQALANPATSPINFKFGPDNGPHLPTNLPMLQNQPLHNFTMKNQHLLKPPTVMEASKYLLVKNI